MDGRRFLININCYSRLRIALFYRASSDSAVYAVVICLSVRLSVTSRRCIKMAEFRMTQISHIIAHGIFFLVLRIILKFQRGYATRGAKRFTSLTKVCRHVARCRYSVFFWWCCETYSRFSISGKVIYILTVVLRGFVTSRPVSG